MRACSGTVTLQPEAALRRAARRRAAAGRSARSARPASPVPSPSLSRGAGAVVGDLGAGLVERRRDGDGAVRRAAVADDVRRRLAHGPGQHRLAAGGSATSGACRWRRCPPRERHPRAGQLVDKRRLAVAADRLAHLAQRRARDVLDVGESRAARLRVGVQQPRGELGLQRDHRQAMAEQVVQVAREAQPLLGDGAPRDLAARLAQRHVGAISRPNENIRKPMASVVAVSEIVGGVGAVETAHGRERRAAEDPAAAERRVRRMPPAASVDEQQRPGRRSASVSTPRAREHGSWSVSARPAIGGRANGAECRSDEGRGHRGDDEHARARRTARAR